MLRDLDELIVPALTNWQHPRFFAYFAVTASEPGILAELLAATLNQVAILWRTSPGVDRARAARRSTGSRQLLGLPEGWHGHIEDTASTSTLAALIAARHVTGRNVVVCSEHAHSSVEKAARMLGMELRKIAGGRRARGCALDGLELDDAAAVVATVGTTSFASVDPVRELAERAHAAGAWLHVDAAYAGSSWICEEQRWSQDGVELADSLVVNAHKWLLDADGLLAALDVAAGRVPRRRSRSCRSTCARPTRTRTRSASTGRRSAAASGRSSSGRCCAATARRGCSAILREHIRLAEPLRRAGSRRTRAGSSARRSGSRSSSSAGTAPTRRTRRILERVNRER